MSLFQKSVEKKYLNELDTVLVDRKYKDFQHYFGNPAIQENIRNAKEEQFQEGFLRELFVAILGYTLNPHPNFNLTTELKNIANSKKADGAILTRGHDPLSVPVVISVIELKGTDTTDLDKIETQAFGYKNHHPKCVYVITSNFEKLRFYIQNAVDHLDFDLFNLTREQFSLLWLCLAKDNLLNGLPQKIKESSVLQEENITKKLYADYSKFREAIFNNLVTNNPETDKLLLFRKTQKLIDRFLFIFFAEDRLLVPPNSISQIIEKWKDDVDFGDAKPLYHTFKKYFHVLNVGRPKSGNRQEIFAYNGGLFSEDEILDNFNIDDTILFEHTLKLSQYNYETDVDVNILGHIFEHSLGEIENVQAEIKGEKVDSQKTKRKKDGIFYTPKYITKYIVENTIGKLCEEKRAALEIIDEEYAKGRKNRKKDTIAALDKKLTDYRNWLLSLTILDPACGSGAFLNQALDFLITEHRKIDDLRAQLFGSGLVFSDITTDILEKNIYGVDINEESVEIAKLSLWLRTAQKGRKLNKLNNNIKCGNSLIDDPEVAGEKAFNWQNEFPNIFQKKNKKAWHITTATHNSRYSQRMFDSFVKLGEPVWLSEKEEIIVSETIAEIAEKDNLNILAYNICGDHAHILLVCEEEELPKIVQKIKSMSARACNIAMGRTIPAVGPTEHAPSSQSSGEPEIGEHAPRDTRGKTQHHLWTQKFGQNEITSEEQLQNTIAYIRNNRAKHGLDSGACSGKSDTGNCRNKGAGSLAGSLVDIIGNITCTREHAYRTEYKGGFDVVIGNPPYVRQELVKEYSEVLQTYEVFAGKADLYTYFYEKGHNILKENGYLSFISSGKFFEASYGQNLINFLVKNLKFIEVINFDDLEVFTGISAYPLIFTGRKIYNKSDYIFNYCFVPAHEFSSLNEIIVNLPFSQIYINDFVKNDFKFHQRKVASLFEKLNSKSIYLEDLNCLPLVGIKTGFNDGYTNNEINISLNRLYVFGKNLKKYSIPTSDTKIIFPYKKENDEYKLLNENELGDSLLILKNNRETLEKRAIIIDGLKNGSKSWFEYQQINKKIDFDKEYIVYPNVSLGNNFTLSKGNVIDMTGFIIPSNDKYLLSILNSKVCEFVMRNTAITRRGGYQEYKVQYLEKIPIKQINKNEKINFEIIVDKIIELNAFQNQLISSFLKLLLSKFGIDKLSRNLQNWHELDFRDFLKELQKAKVKLSLSEEADWMNYFNEQKQKAQTLKSEIEKTDREIDRMVYELYELTEEEIKIVEGTV
jgi:type I restriction-modification system DNA methylase subunit/REP element-mobilizing transposase RayT